MKKTIFFLITILAVLFSACKKEKTSNERPDNDSVVVVEVPDTLHTSKNSIDWEGEYKGIVPCEDCDGVETVIMLNFDSTFTQQLTYIGKGGPYESTGTFKWDETGRMVHLNFEDGSIAKYQVGEGKLSLLDEYGYTIEGYVLTK